MSLLDIAALAQYCFGRRYDSQAYKNACTIALRCVFDSRLFLTQFLVFLWKLGFSWPHETVLVRVVLIFVGC